MSYRESNSSNRDCYSLTQSRLSQQIKVEPKDEGCPVIEESGSVCGETNTLSVFQEFRQMYDDCLRNLEGSVNGSATLTKLAPFKKLIDDLWEQNAMLVETVEELEHEATCRVTNLQDRLNKSCQKICDYKDDIKHLVKIIQSFCENGVFDPTGLQFKTFCCASVFGNCDADCPSTKGVRMSDPSFKRKSVPMKSSSVYNSVYNCPVEVSNQNFRSCFDIGTVRSQNVNSLKRETSSICGSISNTFQSNTDCPCDLFDSQGTSNHYVSPVNVDFKLENPSVCDGAECSCNCSCTSRYTMV